MVPHLFNGGNCCDKSLLVRLKYCYVQTLVYMPDLCALHIHFPPEKSECACKFLVLRPVRLIFYWEKDVERLHINYISHDSDIKFVLKSFLLNWWLQCASIFHIQQFWNEQNIKWNFWIYSTEFFKIFIVFSINET